MKSKAEQAWEAARSLQVDANSLEALGKEGAQATLTLIKEITGFEFATLNELIMHLRTPDSHNG